MLPKEYGVATRGSCRAEAAALEGDPDTIFCILQVVGDAPKVLRTERLRTVSQQSQKRTHSTAKLNAAAS